MTVAVTIPNNIKTVLEEKGISPYKLAQMWGKRSNYVYMLVNQDTLPDGTDLKTLVDIADLLNVSVDRLIGRKGV